MKRRQVPRSAFRLPCLLLFAAAAPAAAAAVEPSLRPLDFSPAAISADGRVVVGVRVSHSDAQSVRWTADGGPVSGLFPAFPAAVSADGSVVVGTNTWSEVDRGGFRWTAGGGLGALDMYWARGVSADGSVVVGRDEASFGGGGGWSKARRWTAGGGTVDLPSTFELTSAAGVSADGTVVVGAGGTGWYEWDVAAPSSSEAFRWTAAGGMVGLGALPGTYSRATAVSADGSVVIGQSGGAFRWTAEAGMVGLGVLGNDHESHAGALSFDGGVIVGTSIILPGAWDRTPTRAFIWDQLNGMRDLREVLAALGADVTGWQLDGATGISADGFTIVGTRTGPSGLSEGWIATIPEPQAMLLLLLAVPLIERTRRRPVDRSTLRTVT